MTSYFYSTTCFSHCKDNGLHQDNFRLDWGCHSILQNCWRTCWIRLVRANFESSQLVVWWVQSWRHKTWSWNMKTTKHQFCVSERATLILNFVFETTGSFAGSGAMHVVHTNAPILFRWWACVVGIRGGNLFRQPFPTCPISNSCIDPAKTNIAEHIMPCAWCSWSSSCYVGEWTQLRDCVYVLIAWQCAESCNIARKNLT